MRRMPHPGSNEKSVMTKRQRIRNTGQEEKQFLNTKTPVSECVRRGARSWKKNTRKSWRREHDGGIIANIKLASGLYSQLPRERPLIGALPAVSPSALPSQEFEKCARNCSALFLTRLQGSPRNTFIRSDFTCPDLFCHNEPEYPSPFYS